MRNGRKYVLREKFYAHSIQDSTKIRILRKLTTVPNINKIKGATVLDVHKWINDIPKKSSINFVNTNLSANLNEACYSNLDIASKTGGL